MQTRRTWAGRCLDVGLMLACLAVLELVIVRVPLQVASTLAHPIHSHSPVPRDDLTGLGFLRNSLLAVIVKHLVVHSAGGHPPQHEPTENPFCPHESVLGVEKDPRLLFAFSRTSSAHLCSAVSQSILSLYEILFITRSRRPLGEETAPLGSSIPRPTARRSG